MKVPLGQIFILPKGSAVVNQTRYVPIESSARNEESNANVLRFEFRSATLQRNFFIWKNKRPSNHHNETEHRKR